MRSTLIGIVVNIFLAIGKLLAGIFGHSYALVADAIESGMDVVSSILVYFGLKVSTLPADENHPQGHGKAEPLAAGVVSLFLFLAAFGIGYESIERIRTPHRLPEIWTLAVLLAVVAIKEALVRFSLKVGQQTGSNAVKADALHQRTDTLTSIAAFVGILVAQIGSHIHPDSRWASADDWAALVASVVIFHNGVNILRGALFELTDAHLGARFHLHIPGFSTHQYGVAAIGRSHAVAREQHVALFRILPTTVLSVAELNGSIEWAKPNFNGNPSIGRTDADG